MPLRRLAPLACGQFDAAAGRRMTPPHSALAAGRLMDLDNTMTEGLPVRRAKYDRDWGACLFEVPLSCAMNSDLVSDFITRKESIAKGFAMLTTWNISSRRPAWHRKLLDFAIRLDLFSRVAFCTSARTSSRSIARSCSAVLFLGGHNPSHARLNTE